MKLKGAERLDQVYASIRSAYSGSLKSKGRKSTTENDG